MKGQIPTGTCLKYKNLPAQSKRNPAPPGTPRALKASVSTPGSGRLAPRARGFLPPATRVPRPPSRSLLPSRQGGLHQVSEPCFERKTVIGKTTASLLLKEGLGVRTDEVRHQKDHRMVGVGRALWGPPAQPPAQAGSPRAAAQHRGQAGLEYLQRRRLHSLPGQPVPSAFPSTNPQHQYQHPMPAPSIKPLMPNAFPSTNSPHQYQCMRHWCPRCWSTKNVWGLTCSQPSHLVKEQE